MLRRFSSFLSHWLDQLQPSETIVLGVAAVLVGLLSGAGVWLFKYLIEFAHELAFEGLGASLEPLGAWTILLVPLAGGVVVGLITHFLIAEERHHGVAGIMEAVALSGGRLRYWRIPAKAVAAAVGIGFGASVGPEDPSVQIGGNLGSMFGQWFRLSDERVRTLVSAGVAGGVASAFNAPITGVFFALEIVLGELSGGQLGIVLLSAVIASVFTQAVSGPQPAFPIPAYAFNSPWELPLYLGLGLIAGPVSGLYVIFLRKIRSAFHAWRVPRGIKPVAAGLMVGLVAIALPGVMGEGYATIGGILTGQNYGIVLLIALMIAKLVMTPISLGGEFQGGIFAPALFIGATLGGAYGVVAARLFPALNIQPPAFAMVGMAAVLAGVVHAPLTAIIMLFELTHDYRVILPLMFAVGVTFIVSRRLQRESFYMLGLAEKGIRLDRGRDVEVMEGLTIGEVMQTEPATLRETDSLTDATATLNANRHHGLPVMNGYGELVGVITLQDIDSAQMSDNETPRTVGKVCTRDLLTAYPDETIGNALRRMSVRDIGRLPVVARENPRRLVGLLRRTDLVRAYDAALTRREAMRHRVHQVRLGAYSGIHVEEIVVEAGATCEGKQIHEIKWPRESVIASLRRGRRVLIPHGDTVLQEGDVLAVVADGDSRAEVKSLCSKADKDLRGLV